jgi:hypothetical protein
MSNCSKRPADSSAANQATQKQLEKQRRWPASWNCPLTGPVDFVARTPEQLCRFQGAVCDVVVENEYAFDSYFTCAKTGKPLQGPDGIWLGCGHVFHSNEVQQPPEIVLEKVERLNQLCSDKLVGALINPVYVQFCRDYAWITCPICRVNSLIHNKPNEVYKNTYFSCPVVLSVAEFTERMYKK